MQYMLHVLQAHFLHYWHYITLHYPDSCMHAYIHTYLRTCILTYRQEVHIYRRTYVHTCIMHASIHMNAAAQHDSAHGSKFLCMHWIHTYVHECMHPSIIHLDETCCICSPRSHEPMLYWSTVARYDQPGLPARP